MIHGRAHTQLAIAAEQAQAEAAVAELVAQLQRGLDTSDADTYDHSFSSDILWGSPYGATVRGIEELSAIHHRLMALTTAPASRFEVVAVIAPAPGVAVAHIRRRALTEGGFSEMALYVLVRREEVWWLAAAQNTPVVTP